MAEITLNEITWGHSRGFTPLMAAAQRFQELHPDVEINWKKRTLQEFADYPIERLTQDYDLLIIDHPWVGCAAATHCVLPLEQWLPAAFLRDQADHSVGASHNSYMYDSHQWALAIDAATPVASYRADLMHQNDQPTPETWQDVLDLAKKGKVAVPGIPVDVLMNFYMFCIAVGEMPFADTDAIVSTDKGIEALEQMRAFYALVDTRFFSCNPIAVAERMSSTDDFWYCPFAYGYSNYARRGYATHLLTYTDLVHFNGLPLCSTLGGTGLAISAFSKHKTTATQFAAMVASGLHQETFYVEHGGQPGHRNAWTSAQANSLTHNYFANTLPALDRAFVRPRYNGYLHFQDTAGEPLQHFLQHGGNANKLLENLNNMYRESLINSSIIS